MPACRPPCRTIPGRLGYWHVGVPPSGPMDASRSAPPIDWWAMRSRRRGWRSPSWAPPCASPATPPSRSPARISARALNGAPVALLAGGRRSPRDRMLELGSGAGRRQRARTSRSRAASMCPSISAAEHFHPGTDSAAMPAACCAPATCCIWSAGSSPASRAAPASACPAVHATSGRSACSTDRTARPISSRPKTSRCSSPRPWKVHYNSDRTGVRLIGPKPNWARKDGGEAGLHPSNIHDNAYAIGTVDFTGDMPVILGPDGPSLGGFVCPATIATTSSGRSGQLRPGDLVRFRPRERTRKIRSMPAASAPRGVVCRADGDRYLLVEYGPNVLDLNLRFRVHALEQQLRAARTARHHRHHARRPLAADSLRHPLPRPREPCSTRSTPASGAIPDLDDISAPSRIVHLPLSWDDPATLLAIRKYMQSVRPDAPWCPSNIEFIRRINGLDSDRRRAPHRVRRQLSGARPGRCLPGRAGRHAGRSAAPPGDHQVQSGAHLDAGERGRHRRRLHVRVRHGRSGRLSVRRPHAADVEYLSTLRPPWLLRFFDQIRFYPVSAAELLEIREDFPHGGYPLRHRRAGVPAQGLSRVSAIRSAARARNSSAGSRRPSKPSANAGRWPARTSSSRAGDRRRGRSSLDALPEGCRAVCSPVTASVWNIAVEAGQRVQAGQKLMVLEAMKMEIAVSAPSAGVGRNAELRAGRAGHRGTASGDATAGGMKMNRDIKLDLGPCASLYKSGAATPVGCHRDDLRPHERAATGTGLDLAWCRARRRSSRARKLERDPVGPVRPLYGVPFAIKDNIDLAGLPTTAAARPTPTRRDAAPRWCRRWWTPARSRSARPTWISSPPAWWARARRTARAPAFTTRATSRAARVPDRRWRWRRDWPASRWAPTRPGRAACPAAFNGLVGLEAHARPAERARRGAGLPHAGLRLDLRADLRRRAHGVDARRAASTRRTASRACRAPAMRRAPWLAGGFSLRRAAARTSSNSSATMPPRRCTRRRWSAWKRWAGARSRSISPIFRAAADLLYAGPWVAERYAAIRDFIERMRTR